MRKADVRIGAVYGVKVSGRVVPVRLDREVYPSGWFGTNLVTNRRIRIRTAARLRPRPRERDQPCEPTPPPAARPA